MKIENGVFNDEGQSHPMIFFYYNKNRGYVYGKYKQNENTMKGCGNRDIWIKNEAAIFERWLRENWTRLKQ